MPDTDVDALRSELKQMEDAKVKAADERRAKEAQFRAGHIAGLQAKRRQAEEERGRLMVEMANDVRSADQSQSYAAKQGQIDHLTEQLRQTNEELGKSEDILSEASRKEHVVQNASEAQIRDLLLVKEREILAACSVTELEDELRRRGLKVRSR